MAEQPSLGGAIALQGRNTIAEQLGRMKFQAAQREAAAAQKLALQGKQQQQKQEDQIRDLFKERGRIHPLVLPEVDKIFDQTITELENVKSSDNPFDQNKYARIERDLRGRMIDLRSYSNKLDAFDNQIKFLDTRRKYYGDAVAPFLERYRTAGSLDDLRKFAQENPNASDFNFQVDPNGIPQLVEEEAVPYMTELPQLAKSLPDVVQYRSMVSIPGFKNAKEMQDMWGRPLRIKDAEQAMKDNPGLYKTRPLSLEDQANAYMDMRGDDLIRQMNSRMNLGIVRGPEGYTQADKEKVKDALIMFMAPYANPELKGKIVQERGGFNISLGAGEKSMPGELTKSFENVNLQQPGEKMDDVVTTEAQRKAPQFASSYAKIGVGVPNTYVQASDEVRDKFGNKLSGSYPDATIIAIRMMPYKIIKGTNGQDVKVVARASEASKIKGVSPFVQLGITGKDFYTPLTNFSDKNAFAGSKYDATSWTPIFTNFWDLEATVNKGLAGKTWKNQAEFDNIVKPLLK